METKHYCEACGLLDDYEYDLCPHCAECGAEVGIYLCIYCHRCVQCHNKQDCKDWYQPASDYQYED